MAGPSKRDREKLRERVKTELRKQGRTQKDLEEALGVTSGTLTRVFGGRRKLDAELATGLARELETDVDELFRATSFLNDLELPEADAAPAKKAKAAPKTEKAEPEQKAAPKVEKTAEPQSAKKAEPKAEEKAEPKTEKAEPKAEKKGEPTAEKKGEATAQKNAEPQPAPEPVRPTPPPPEEPRFRKRDIPLKAARFLLGLVFGD